MVKEQLIIANVRRIFNEMADEYDHLADLWYSYTFKSIDKAILSELQPACSLISKPVALDIGCGTGIQSLRLASMGYKVIGVDIADDLLKMAAAKLRSAGYHDAEFYSYDAQSLPFSDSIANVANCCGPTLPFIPDWKKALREISRCLKSGGKLLLEIEGKWNFDLFWEILNAIGFNFLHFDETLWQSLRHLLPPWNIGHNIEYSFKLESNGSVTMPLKLFTTGEINKALRDVDLSPYKRWGLHGITNIVPSTILHKAFPRRSMYQIFQALAAFEKSINMYWPANAFACSLLVLAKKVGPKKED